MLCELKISRAVRRGGFRRGGRHSERPIGFDSRASFFNFLRRHTKTAKNSYLCTTQRHRAPAGTVRYAGVPDGRIVHAS